MKTPQNIIKLLLAIMVLPIIAACEKDEVGEDAMLIRNFFFYVKFESSTGANILDSLDLYKYTSPIAPNTKNHTDDILDFSWTTQNNDLEKNNSWKTPTLYWISTQNWDLESPNFSVKDVGTVLAVQVCDIRISRKYFPECDEVYYFYIKSKAIFGNEDSHKITYYIHINGYARGYYVTKCEVDGKDYPLEGPFTTIHPEWGIQLEWLFVKFKVNPQQLGH